MCFAVVCCNVGMNYVVEGFGSRVFSEDGGLGG